MSEPDPGDLARLRAELAYVTAPQRLGFLLAGLGVMMAILRGTALPGLPKLVPVVLIVTALGLLAIGTIRRLRWHRRRMRSVQSQCHPGSFGEAQESLVPGSTALPGEKQELPAFPVGHGGPRNKSGVTKD